MSLPSPSDHTVEENDLRHIVIVSIGALLLTIVITFIIYAMIGWEVKVCGEQAISENSNPTQTCAETEEEWPTLIEFNW